MRKIGILLLVLTTSVIARPEPPFNSYLPLTNGNGVKSTYGPPGYQPGIPIRLGNGNGHGYTNDNRKGNGNGNGNVYDNNIDNGNSYAAPRPIYETSPYGAPLNRNGNLIGLNGSGNGYNGNRNDLNGNGNGYNGYNSNGNRNGNENGYNPSPIYEIANVAYGPPRTVYAVPSFTYSAPNGNGNGNGNSYHNENDNRNGNGKPSTRYGAPTITYGALNGNENGRPRNGYLPPSNGNRINCYNRNCSYGNRLNGNGYNGNGNGRYSKPSLLYEVTLNGNGNDKVDSIYGAPLNGNGINGNGYNGNGKRNGNGNGLNGNGLNGNGLGENRNGFNGKGNGNGYNGNGNGNGYNSNRSGNGFNSNEVSGTYGPPSNGNGYRAPVQNGNGRPDEDFIEPAKYKFEYQIIDKEAGLDFGHKEARDGDVAVGEYNVLLPDGRKQLVVYQADTEGYKPTVTYEIVGNGNANGNGYSIGPSNGGYS